MSGSETNPFENAERLRGELLERLLAESPASVLDVGCGRGELLRACASARIPCLGLEADAERVADAHALGLPVARASAQRLPVATDAVAWAVMRHVAHHLERPRDGVHELTRVARDGVVLAEPWRPTDDPAQVTASAVDAFTRHHERRRGRVHGPDLPAERLLGWLAETGSWLTRVETVRTSALLPTGLARAELERAVADLPGGHAARDEARELADRVERTGVGATGSVIVVARRS